MLGGDDAGCVCVLCACVCVEPFPLSPLASPGSRASLAESRLISVCTCVYGKITLRVGRGGLEGEIARASVSACPPRASLWHAQAHALALAHAHAHAHVPSAVSSFVAMDQIQRVRPTTR